jgi:hypothetical protein
VAIYALLEFKNSKLLEKNFSFLLLKNLSLAGGYWISISFSGRIGLGLRTLKTSTGFTDLGLFSFSWIWIWFFLDSDLGL